MTSANLLEICKLTSWHQKHKCATSRTWFFPKFINFSVKINLLSKIIIIIINKFCFLWCVTSANLLKILQMNFSTKRRIKNMPHQIDYFAKINLSNFSRSRRLQNVTKHFKLDWFQSCISHKELWVKNTSCMRHGKKDIPVLMGLIHTIGVGSGSFNVFGYVCLSKYLNFV